MNKLIQLAIERRWLLVALFLLMGFFGYYSFQQLAIEAYPDIADVTSQVITQVPGLAAEEIEERITTPLERELNGTPGLAIMRSKSTFGLSIITMVFNDGVDDYWARQRIQERIASVDLPAGVNPGLDPLTSPIGEIYRYTLQSTTRDIRALKELQQWVVVPELKKVFGVADVTSFGGITTQFQVEVDPNKLDQYGVSLDELEQTIQRNNNNAGGSVLVRGSLGYVVRGIGLVRSLADLGNIVITEKNGVPIFLKDMGIVNYGSIQRSGLVAINDHSDVVSGIALLLKHQNPSQVLAGIHQAADRLNGGLLPADVKLVPYLDRTSLVETTLHTVSKTLLEGMGLVVLVLILFLGSWRGALLVAITVPLSLLFAFIMMYMTNIPANLLSLGAIDFGILVDGAIVMMESVLTYRETNQHETLKERSIADVAASVARPILFATLIIVTAYIPLFAFERVERKLFTPMAFTVGYALFGALLVALLLIPGLSFSAYRIPRKLFHNRWLDRLTTHYERAIGRILRQPSRVFTPLSAVLVVVGILTYTVGKDFLPYLDEGSIWVQVTLPPGLSLAKSQQMANQLIQETRKSTEVTYMMIQVGRNDDGTDPWTPSHFECSIGLKPYSEWPSGKTKQDLIAELETHYKKLPGYVIGFSQPMIDGVMDKIAGAHSELVVKIFGRDFKETRRIAEDVERTLKATPGAVDVSIDQEPPLPQLQVMIDRDRVARYGLNVSDVNELLSTAIGGRPISTLFVGERRYDITVRYAPEFRASPDAIGNLLLTAPNGARIPISQVADIRLETGESTITREMTKRHLTVKLNLRGRDLSSFLTDAQARIDRQVRYDRNQYSINWGGQFENQQRAYARLGIIVPLALAIMFVLLFGAFGRFDQAGLVLSVIPLAALGGVLALNIRGMTLNVSSAVGFIALFGVAIQNGVIMIAHLNEVVHASGMLLKDAVIKAARDRFRPVLMTATVATLGLLPASLSTGIGSDVQRPLATVIVYGLSTATLLTLFALPALYYLLENRYGHPKTTPTDA